MPTRPEFQAHSAPTQLCASGPVVAPSLGFRTCGLGWDRTGSAEVARGSARSAHNRPWDCRGRVPNKGWLPLDGSATVSSLGWPLYLPPSFKEKTGQEWVPTYAS